MTHSLSLLKAWELIQRSSKTCKLSILYCNISHLLPRAPPHTHVSNPLRQASLPRMPRPFLYSLVARACLRERQQGGFGQKNAAFFHIFALFKP